MRIRAKPRPEETAVEIENRKRLKEWKRACNRAAWWKQPEPPMPELLKETDPVPPYDPRAESAARVKKREKQRERNRLAWHRRKAAAVAQAEAEILAERIKRYGE